MDLKERLSVFPHVLVSGIAGGRMNRYDIYRLIRNELSTNYLIYKYFAERNGAQLLKENTDLVIEGFPRSANSFFEAALRYYFPNNLQYAHHCHARAHVEEAVQRGIPCVVLIRNPVDAIVSYLEESEKLSSPGVLFREYNIFYDKIEKLLPRIMLISFETVRTNPAHAIGYVAHRMSFHVDSNELKRLDVDQLLDQVAQIAKERVGITPAYRRKTEGYEESTDREMLRRKLREKVMHYAPEFLRRRAHTLFSQLEKRAI